MVKDRQANRQYLIKTPQKLDYHISWLPIPKRAPQGYQHRLSKRRDFWTKQALVLNLVRSGFSLEAEIKPLVARRADTSTMSVYRAIKSLDENRILHRKVLTLPVALPHGVEDIKYSLIRLNRLGRGLCRTLAGNEDPRWRPYETGWERMQRLHEKGKVEPRHTLGTLVFAYQARQRGWKSWVMPEYQAGRFVPDAAVEKDGERIYGEVEFGYGKEAKWRNMQDALGYAAFCARSPGHERALLEECGKIRKRVYTTNLTRLITREGALWEEKRLEAG